MNTWRQWTFGILGVMLASGILGMLNSPPRGEPVRLLPPPTPLPILIHVSGAVESPGVYALPPGSRAQDAVAAAGGFLPTAYTGSVNLAAFLEDGQKILILTIEERAASDQIGSPDGASLLININTATLEELQLLPGIGPTKALAIINYRIKNSAFSSIEEIQNIPGIGPGTFENLKDLITVGD